MRTGTTVLISSVLAACAATTRVPQAPSPLPQLTLSRTVGGSWSSASAHGSVLVIDVWASWCKPCAKAFPKLAALAARRPDVIVVALSIDEDPVAMRALLTQLPAAVVAVQDFEQVVTRAPLVISKLPTVLIVDPEGLIRNRLEEPSERDYDHLDELIDRAKRQVEIDSH